MRKRQAGGDPVREPARLSPRLCAFCGKPKGTIPFRQDRAVLDAAGISHVSGGFFAHLKCMRQFQQQNR